MVSVKQVDMTKKYRYISFQEHRYYNLKLSFRQYDIGNGWTFASFSVWKNAVNAVVGGGRLNLAVEMHFQSSVVRYLLCPTVLLCSF